MPPVAVKAPKDKVAAALYVYGAPDFTKRGRRDIVRWLRERARDIEYHSADLDPIFRARYLYPARARAKKKK